MKIIIFAGGVGTRLWPLSRKSSPKQFEKIIGDKSTLQLAVERLMPDFSWKDIFIFTGKDYVSIVKTQLPKVPQNQIIGEPQTRDVGPAVGLACSILFKESPNEPIGILWSDHLVKNDSLFRKILIQAKNYIENYSNKIIFIGQKPRFASQNLGWIEFGKEVSKLSGISLHSFLSFRYRPDLETASKFLKDGQHAWNLGYFVTTPAFLWNQYKRFAPHIFNKLTEIQKYWRSESFNEKLAEIYPTCEKISFDNLILEKVHSNDALVISENIEWSDVGAWEALKEALQKQPAENITKGKVLLTDCNDTLVYNYTKQMVTSIDLNGYLIVVTDDVVLVCHKNSVPKIKKIVESFSGTKNEALT